MVRSDIPEHAKLAITFKDGADDANGLVVFRSKSMQEDITSTNMFQYGLVPLRLEIEIVHPTTGPPQPL